MKDDWSFLWSLLFSLPLSFSIIHAIIRACPHGDPRLHAFSLALQYAAHMASNPPICVQVSLRRIEADGQTCYCCNDVIYLNAFGLFQRIVPREWPTEPTFAICQSCRDVAAERWTKDLP